MTDDDPLTPPGSIAPLLERARHVSAPIDTVWRLLGDPCLLVDLSPTVQRVELESGAPGTEGARYVNHNRQGDLEWVTHSVITCCTAPRMLAFRIEENWSVWSFELDPSADGTRVVQRRRTPEGISPLALELTDAFMGGQEEFTRTLLQGMDQTLERIKAAAEAR